MRVAKDGSATAIAARLYLRCLADTPVGSYRSEITRLKRSAGGLPPLQTTRLVLSGAEYTPLDWRCQHIVVIFFINAIESVILL